MHGDGNDCRLASMSFRMFWRDIPSRFDVSEPHQIGAHFNQFGTGHSPLHIVERRTQGNPCAVCFPAERQGQPSRQPKAHKRVVTAAFGQALLEDADFIACVRQAVLQGEVEFHD